MQWQLSSYGMILILAAVISATAAISAWKRSVSSKGRLLSLFMAAVFIWTFAAALEAATGNLQAKIILAKFQYLGIATSPVLVFLFALKFARENAKIKPAFLGFLWIIPAAVLCLALTNDWHRLVWEKQSLAPLSPEGLLASVPGPFFWVHVVFAYLLTALTTAFLAKAYFRFRGIQRQQALALLLALPWPWAGNILFLSGWADTAGRDFTPLGFAIAGLLLLWGMYRLQLIDIAPIARKKVIESMHDSLIVLDEAGRVADLNPAAMQLLEHIGSQAAGQPQTSIIGRPASKVFGSWPSLTDSLDSPRAGRRELVWDSGNKRRDFDLSLSPLSGYANHLTGWVAVLYEITGLKRAETEAVEARILAETLQDAGMTLSATLKLDHMSVLILELINKVVPFDVGAFLLPEGAELKIAGIRGLSEGGSLIGQRFSVSSHRLCNLVMQQRHPMILKHFEDGDILLPLPEEKHVRSFLGVPIVFQDHVTGILSLFSLETHRFDDKDVRVAELFANQVAIALENSRLYEQMSQLAKIDNLTGLNNRRHFFELAEKEFERARRYKRTLSVILFDIDDFKAINDTHGHLIGDQVLRALASSVKPIIRKTDILCRYGGDEFLVLMPEAGRDQALIMAERLRQKIAEIVIVTTAGNLSMTVSVGIASREKNSDANLEQFIARADNAMYEAKATGRNKVCG